MKILCLLQAVANISLVGVVIWREKTYRAVVADLLDRVMARSYGEYVAATTPAPDRPLRRRVLSDAEMAELESRRVGAGAA